MPLSAKELFAARLGNSMLIELIKAHSKIDPTITEGSEPVDEQRMYSRGLYAFNTYLRPCLEQYFEWLHASNEGSNYSYDITSLNKQHLAGFLNVLCGVSLPQAMFYFQELNGDPALKAHITGLLKSSPFDSAFDANPDYGRRLGWYALIRSKKPRLVIETGVDKGLGSCVITAALMANHQEGFSGTYLGTDINPAAGFLLQGPYADFGKVLYGDSLESLAALQQPVDIFINDSDHSTDYEAREYTLIHSKLADKAVIFGDNTHCSGALYDYATRYGKRFMFFSEKPEKHWYPGAGIGASW